ncbi:uncharacterized protein LOC107511021 isoform X2 [Rousettus aegyptiacus]|uniref:uncharacterized protein LOC107511021 isoform X2 n=1 Tax=Rousettus aegyptiacus TaxID=9407 RepID=UPI00168D6D0B|nr:uncharacterized protein LOC107511021 isoform X2 [Rousettus aegyptiacus]
MLGGGPSGSKMRATWPREFWRSSVHRASLTCWLGVFYGCEGAEIITPKASWKKRAVFPVPTVWGEVGHVTRLHPDGTPCEVQQRIHLAEPGLHTTRRSCVRLPQQRRHIRTSNCDYSCCPGPQGARLPSSRSKTNEDTVAMATADSCLPDARGTSLSMKLALRSADGGTEKSKSLKIHRDIGLIEFEVSLTPHKICSYVNR